MIQQEHSQTTDQAKNQRENSEIALSPPTTTRQMYQEVDRKHSQLLTIRTNMYQLKAERETSLTAMNNQMRQDKTTLVNARNNFLQAQKIFQESQQSLNAANTSLMSISEEQIKENSLLVNLTHRITEMEKVRVLYSVEKENLQKQLDSEKSTEHERERAAHAK